MILCAGGRAADIQRALHPMSAGACPDNKRRLMEKQLCHRRMRPTTFRDGVCLFTIHWQLGNGACMPSALHTHTLTHSYTHACMHANMHTLGLVLALGSGLGLGLLLGVGPAAKEHEKGFRGVCNHVGFPMGICSSHPCIPSPCLEYKCISGM